VACDTKLGVLVVVVSVSIHDMDGGSLCGDVSLELSECLGKLSGNGSLLVRSVEMADWKLLRSVSVSTKVAKWRKVLVVRLDVWCEILWSSAVRGRRVSMVRWCVCTVPRMLVSRSLSILSVLIQVLDPVVYVSVARNCWFWMWSKRRFMLVMSSVCASEVRPKIKCPRAGNNPLLARVSKMAIVLRRRSMWSLTAVSILYSIS